ncbi:ComEC/Rec2 family competence protein [Pleionea sp. CnH1-48]|uniref:ComEC/Rec2 family competence protein n=1 Tax=Pleionea sp. CnH1-48 TaxID=2954494 RepID=UPI0020972F24|nr:MBL fold metallo-hydrolase [Pleionea sp. CnH1-48]MCO7227548.1 MBL fold metallo-hydrolase [Pleionea sp. CnH1-48]
MIKVIFSFLFIAGIILSQSSYAEPLAQDTMRVHFINVGQADATLVEFSCAAILIDTGAESSSDVSYLVNYIKRFFERRTDLGGQLAQLIITHPHPDHTKGVSKMIESFKPRNIVTNGQDTGFGVGAQNDARVYANETGGVKGWYVLERKIDKDKGLVNQIIDPVTCDGHDPKITALWGQADYDESWMQENYEDENNHSVVIRIDLGEASVLFTGDLEKSTSTSTRNFRPAGIERLVEAYKGTGLLDVDVYQVGHHGASNGTTVELLDEMSPEIAVFSTGPACERSGFTAWSHAHPRTSVVQMLNDSVRGNRNQEIIFPSFVRWNTDPVYSNIRKAIYSTGVEGTVVLEGKADGSWKEIHQVERPACLSE